MADHSKVVLATDQFTAWNILATVVWVLVVSALVYALIRILRRSRARQEKLQQAIAKVPPEWRFQPEPLVLRLAVFAAATVAGVAAQLVAHRPWGVIAAALVILPFWVRAQRRRQARQQQVIEAVRARAGRMGSRHLAELLDGLEASHGREEMRPLRHLRPALDL